MGRALVLLPLALLSFPPVALAGDCRNIETSPCFTVCPAGDWVFRVDGANLGNGCPNGTVAIQLAGCTGVQMAEVGPGILWNSTSRILFGVTRPDGIVDFTPKAGGTCSGVSIAVQIDGRPGPTLHAVSSFDQDGDLLVDATDLSAVSAKLGMADPTADFDCDGQVSGADVAIAEAHRGHSTDYDTYTTSRSWGQIKTIYR